MITQRVKMIFSAYRRDDFADPEGFAVQLGVVLERYADEIIHLVSDPRTGIQRRCKFPPSIAEVVEFCDAEATTIATRERYWSMPSPTFHRRLEGPPRAQPGCRANVLVLAAAPQYADMLSRAQDPTAGKLDYRFDADGFWVSHTWLQPDAKRSSSGPRQFTADDLRAMYPPQRQEEAPAA